MELRALPAQRGESVGERRFYFSSYSLSVPALLRPGARGTGGFKWGAFMVAIATDMSSLRSERGAGSPSE